jgi:hypothetical protein
MIASRQIAFGGSKRKPYDAEIEYLESTGTQYIDTGIVLTADDNLASTKLSTTNFDFTSDNAIYGCQTSNSDAVVCFRNMAGRVRFRWGSELYKDINVVRNRPSEVVVELSDSALTATCIDNGESVTIPQGKQYSPFPLFLFGSNKNGEVWLSKGARIYYFKLSNKLDLIPVRVGDVGYMYDRVSGQLFGNAGEGSFVLGSDI